MIEPSLAVHVANHVLVKPFLAVQAENQASIESSVLVGVALVQIYFPLLILGLTLVVPLLVAYSHPFSWF